MKNGMSQILSSSQKEISFYCEILFFANANAGQEKIVLFKVKNC